MSSVLQLLGPPEKMTIKVHEKLLLTGAAGGLGKALRDRLKATCSVLRLSDVQAFGEALDGEEIILADLADAAAVDSMVKGVDAIIHLGGMSVEGPFGPILQANILGVYNLYEAARKHGVKRVVFASSNHVTGFYRQDQTITADHPARPDGLYGLSKAFGEDLSRFYFDRYGIETACVRIGSSFAEPRDRRMLATWLSFDDLHRLITACLTTPVLGHSIIFGMSDNAVTWWDNSRARHIGYVPQDSSDVFRDAVYARTTSPDLNDPVAQYQGGGFVVAGPFGG
jgi:uronate dehydrogenase